MKKKNKMNYVFIAIGVLAVSILFATTVRAINDNGYENMHQGMMNMMNGDMHSMHTDMDAMHESCEEMMGGEMHEECEEMMQSGQCPMMK